MAAELELELERELLKRTCKERPVSTIPRDSYLVTEVMTAPPQKLHLLLVEAALRHCRATLQHWRTGESDNACETVIKAQEIMGELLAGLDRTAEAELVERVASIYAFVYRSLIEAAFRRDEARLAGAIRVLEIERETWRQLCEQLGSMTADERTDPPLSQPILPPKSVNMPPLTLDSTPAEYSGGFSLDA